MKQQYYQNLGDFDKRFDGESGMVYQFETQAEFDAAIKHPKFVNCNPLTNRARLVFIVLGEHENANA